VRNRILWSLTTAVLAAVVVGSAVQLRTIEDAARPLRSLDPAIREALVRELQPVVLANCEFARFGERNDGGYLMCSNLLNGVEAGYSYGIANYDKWGCDISTKLRVRLHQYDCFDTRQPPCPGGDTVFHAECVADAARTDEGRVFDSMQNQFAKNGDAAKRLVVKMDVEGAEWDSLLHASDETLQRIDQLAIELHFVDQKDFLQVVRRLKQFFHVVHLHYNNYACAEGIAPLPAVATELLFVNKRIGQVDSAQQWRGPHPLATPSAPGRPDCQGRLR